MRFDLGRFGRATLVAAALTCSFAVAGAWAETAPIDVTIDFAKVMKLNKPVHTIVVGNPGIFDATVSDEQTLVLTGKTAGMTNLIVLDDDGAELVNAMVRVSSNVRELTTVFYGAQRQSFSCAPVCEMVVSVGDDNNTFQNATQQIQTRKDFASGQ